KLYSFDFDATLFKTALEEEGRIIWKDKTGYDYPHVGWWSKPETLDLEIFDTPLNSHVYDEYLKAVSDSENFVFLATGRLERLRKQVETILNKNNLSFDGVFLKTGPGDTFYFKTKLFERLIYDLDPEEFIMYDDRIEHLTEFAEWAKTVKCDVTIIDVVNMTTTKIKNR
ncbi:MAG: hypothetical protein ABFD07_07900, partial [Methanobacterium sp.]